MIVDFDIPRAFIRLTELNAAEGCPSGRIQWQSFYFDKLIPLKPCVINISLLVNRIKRCETKHPVSFIWEHHGLVYRGQHLNSFAHRSMDQSGRTGWWPCWGGVIVFGCCRRKIQRKGQESKSENKWLFFKHVATSFLHFLCCRVILASAASEFNCLNYQ